jgi:predicted Zn-dependent protease
LLALRVALALVAFGCGTLVSSADLAAQRWRERVVRVSVALSVEHDAEAEESLRAALLDAETVARTEPERGAELLAHTEMLLGQVAREDDRPVDAERHYRSALAHLENGDAKNEAGRFAALAGLAPVLVEVGRVDEARAVHERAVAILRPTAEPHHKGLADSYSEMGDAFAKRGQADLAVIYYRGSLDVRDFSEGSGRYDVAVTLEHYADALDTLGRSEESQRARARVAQILEGSDYVHDLARSYLLASQEHVALQFGWPRDRFPLRVYLAAGSDHYSDAAALDAAARRGVLAWQNALAPDLPGFTFVDAAYDADIIVRWTDNPGHKEWLGRSERKSLTAVTPVRILVATQRLGVEPSLAELETVVMHEVGHALGLWTHSSYPKDLMYPVYREDVRAPTARDVATLRRIY